MAEYVKTIVIGAGQAGLATSYCLTQAREPHLILEKARLGESWRGGHKWDSFTLVTPNWTLRLPGFHYSGDSPDGFMSRDGVVRYLENYAASFDPPIRYGVEVKAVSSIGDRFFLGTSEGGFEATNVVVATSLFQKPRIPAMSARIAPHIRQLHSSQYANPQSLPAGAVLIVGAGQSGCQIADELRKHGRKVYLSTGKGGHLPRRYRGKDIFQWAELIGMLDRPVTALPDPAARFSANPQLTGADGGRALNLHDFAADGVHLLGRIRDADGTQVMFAGDLYENLEYADKFGDELLGGIDKFIEATGTDAPPETFHKLRNGYDVPIIRQLDLDSEGITSIVWACGYRFDFKWLHFPIFDDYGYPITERGVTSQRGLYFVGLHWLHVLKSSLLIGVGDDAAHVAAHIAR